MSEYKDPFHGALWDSNDADALRSFLETRSGKRFILRLRLDRPSLPGAPELRGDLHAVALSAKRQEGYEEAIANVFDYLVTPADVEATSKEFPNLDDDDAWPEELRKPARELHKDPAEPPNEVVAELQRQVTETIEGSK